MTRILRVDYRLLHGQVAFAWVNHFNINAILIANDDVVNNEMRKTALKIAKPATSKLIFKSLNDSVEAINSGVTDKYNLLIVVENIIDAERLAKGIDIKSINFGLSTKKENSKKIANAVYINEKEETSLRNLLSNDIEVYLQQSPSDKKEIISEELIERG